MIVKNEDNLIKIEFGLDFLRSNFKDIVTTGPYGVKRQVSRDLKEFLGREKFLKLVFEDAYNKTFYTLDVEGVKNMGEAQRRHKFVGLGREL